MALPRLRRENFLAPGGALAAPIPLPELDPRAERWIGCAPLSTADMRGRVWVLKVWTFGCINCVRSIPYANALATRFGDDVRVLGIHSPEFDWERDPEQLRAALAEHDVRFPSYVDESSAYFHALRAPGWPVFYVVDRDARIRGRWFGEVHAGTRRARELEALIRALL
jgi:thiol-disulfide isomerase/thioredoxin